MSKAARSVLERSLLDQMNGADWRLRRVWQNETAAIDLQAAPAALRNPVLALFPPLRYSQRFRSIP